MGVPRQGIWSCPRNRGSGESLGWRGKHQISHHVVQGLPVIGGFLEEDGCWRKVFLLLQAFSTSFSWQSAGSPTMPTHYLYLHLLKPKGCQDPPLLSLDPGWAGYCSWSLQHLPLTRNGLPCPATSLGCPGTATLCPEQSILRAGGKMLALGSQSEEQMVGGSPGGPGWAGWEPWESNVMQLEGKIVGEGHVQLENLPPTHPSWARRLSYKP